VGLFFFLDDMFGLLVTSKVDIPHASRSCTSACHQVCAIPPSAFVPMTTNVTAIAWEYPPALVQKLPADFRPPLLQPVYQRMHTGPIDIWWCDPRKAPAYCSWSWTDRFYEVRVTNACHH
jgi:hypothetical protein